MGNFIRYQLSLSMHIKALVALLLLILLLSAGIWLVEGKDIWQGLVLAADASNGQYAEQVYLDRTLRTSANSWSNLAYFLIGFYCILLARSDRKIIAVEGPTNANFIQRNPLLSTFYGFNCCILGFGSFLFHASLTRIGQQFDVGGMFAIVFATLLIPLAQSISYFGKNRSALSEKKVCLWLAVITALTIVLTFLFKWQIPTNALMSTVSLLTIALLLLNKWLQPYRTVFLFIIASLCFQFLAGWIRGLDIQKVFSGPDDILQGHAVWHCLSAIAIALSYLYFRSEKVE